MSIARIMQQAAAGAVGEALAIEDVFSTYLYTGNGSTQTITNGIDLAGEGGLVWVKNRDEADSHILTDTERGATETLVSNTTAAEATDADTLTAFNADGFALGADVKVNTSTEKYASWTFRKAPRFFDVVTYTGTGSARTVSHNLGLAPGCIMVKKTSSVGDWRVYHRSNTANPETDYLQLNGTASTVDDNTLWNDTAPTATEFTVGTDANVNGNNVTYVAYLFAHDPLGPSGDGSDGLIACGSYTSDAIGKATIDLGWEPQWVLYKASNAVTHWSIADSMRGFVADTASASAKYLNANQSAAELSNAPVGITSTGFKYDSAPNINFIYIAIRRGPMREPTSGTEVFAIDQGDGSSVPAFNAGFPVDFALARRPATSEDNRVAARLTGNAFMETNLTDAQDTSNTNYKFDYQNGFFAAALSSDYYSWMFRRAPGFFDVVAYTGDGVAGRTVSHNLGVAPEMMIVKDRGNATNWSVYHSGLNVNSDNAPETDATFLNLDFGSGDDVDYWNDTAPTSSVFTLGTQANVNGSSRNYIAYLFATLPGISKVGSYTGNGSSQTINCGFTGGARFVLIKRTDSTGDWLVGDTARGIVAGNDPYLELNTTDVEDTDEDWLDTDSSGFIVNQVTTSNANVNTATYIYLAIA